MSDYEKLLGDVNATNARVDADKSDAITGETAGEYVDYFGYVDRALAILKTRGNLSLVGPTGTGKTHLVYELVKKLSEYHDEEVKLFAFRGTGDIQSHNLWTDISLVPNPKGNGTITQVKAGIALQWAMHSGPAVLFADEITFMMQAIISGFHGITDHTQTKTLMDLQDENGTAVVVKRGKDKYFIIAYNPAEKSEYAGTVPMNIAFLRRFEGFWVDYLPEDEERLMLKKLGLSLSDAGRLTQFADFTRTAYQDGELLTPITLGNLKAYANLVIHEGLDLDDIIEIILGKYPEKQHEVVNTLWGRSTGR